MQVSAGLLLFIFLVQTLAFMVKALAGFGDAVVSSPLLALSQMQNEQISPLALLLSFPTNLILTLRNRKHFSFKSCFWLLFFNIAGMVPRYVFACLFFFRPAKAGAWRCNCGAWVRDAAALTCKACRKIQLCCNGLCRGTFGVYIGHLRH